MKKQNEKFLVFILVVLVGMLVALFFFQSKSEEQNIKRNLTKVLVAKVDIPEGEVISQDNLVAIDIGRSDMSEKYLDQEKWTEISNSIITAKSPIYKDEFITTSRIKNSDLKENEKFKLTIDDKKVISKNFEKGDIVQVLVVPHGFGQPFNVIDGKQIIDTKFKTVGSTGEKETTDITISITDEELELYLVAKEVGNITVVSYDDFSDTNQAKVLSFKDAQQFVLQQQKFNSEEKTKREIKTVIEFISEDIEIDVLLENNLLTKEEFLYLNPNLNTENTIINKNRWVRVN